MAECSLYWMLQQLAADLCAQQHGAANRTQQTAPAGALPSVRARNVWQPHVTLGLGAELACDGAGVGVRAPHNHAASDGNLIAFELGGAKLVPALVKGEQHRTRRAVDGVVCRASACDKLLLGQRGARCASVLRNALATHARVATALAVACARCCTAGTPPVSRRQGKGLGVGYTASPDKTLALAHTLLQMEAYILLVPRGRTSGRCRTGHPYLPGRMCRPGLPP